MHICLRSGVRRAMRIKRCAIAMPWSVISVVITHARSRTLSGRSILRDRPDLTREMPFTNSLSLPRNALETEATRRKTIAS